MCFYCEKIKEIDCNLSPFLLSEFGSIFARCHILALTEECAELGGVGEPEYFSYFCDRIVCCCQYFLCTFQAYIHLILGRRCAHIFFEYTAE